MHPERLESWLQHLKWRVGVRPGALAVCWAGWVAGSLFAAEPPADLESKLPRLPPVPPEQALATFQIEDGFVIQLAAAEPHVADPVDLVFAADGRLYVAELRDYPFPPKLHDRAMGRIRLLEDADQDGYYETSRIFADRIHWPSGLALWKGGLYVTAPPDILYLKDTDDDGVADLREVVYTGFGTHTAEDLANNLKWALDHHLYGLTSYNGGEITRPNQPDAPAVSLRNRDFRFSPVTGLLQAISGGHGDFGNTFDDWGNRFVSNAGSPVIHEILPSRYLARNPHLHVSKTHQNISRAGNRVFPISTPEPWRAVRREFWERWVDTTHDMRASRFSREELALQGYITGLSGVTIYRGHVFPEGYRGNAFVGEVANNLVMRLALSPEGVTFRAERTGPEQKEFLASTDNWFRPVNFANGPDGCLYVLDMYREMIEDPSAVPEDILKHLDLTSGMERGRIYRIKPAGFEDPGPVALDQASTADLVAALRHPNAWHRETAHRLLYERQDKEAVPALEELVHTAVLPQTRLHVLWSLAGLNALTTSTLVEALFDPHPALREHAIRLTEPLLGRSSEMRQRILGLAEDPNARVRFQLALTLGVLPGETTLETLAILVQKNAADPWIRAAILSSVASSPMDLTETLLQHDTVLNQAGVPDFLGELAFQIGARRHPADTRRMVELLFQGSLSDQVDVASLILARFASGLQQSGATLAEVVRLQGPEEEKDSKLLNDLVVRQKRLVLDEKTDMKRRLEALALFAQIAPEESRLTMTRLLRPQEPESLQRAAVHALSAMDDREIGVMLVQRWPQFSPSLKSATLDALLRRPYRTRLLLDALEKRYIPPGEINAARRQALINHSNDEIKTRAGLLFQSLIMPDRQKLIQRYQTEMAGLQGDPERGAEVFAATCAQCHQFKGQGHSVGPDLAAVKDRSTPYWLTQILDPNRSVSPAHQNYQLTTKDGQEWFGIIAEETDTHLTLRQPEGQEEIIPRNQILTLYTSGLSLMPEGVESGINPQQMADLIAFLNAP